MSPLSSSMVSLGTKAPAFRLPDPEGKWISSEDFAGAPALLVAFICNHCPYVKHVRLGLRRTREGIPSARRCGGRDQLE